MVLFGFILNMVFSLIDFFFKYQGMIVEGVSTTQRTHLDMERVRLLKGCLLFWIAFMLYSIILIIFFFEF